MFLTWLWTIGIYGRWKLFGKVEDVLKAWTIIKEEKPIRFLWKPFKKWADLFITDCCVVPKFWTRNNQNFTEGQDNSPISNWFCTTMWGLDFSEIKQKCLCSLISWRMLVILKHRSPFSVLCKLLQNGMVHPNNSLIFDFGAVQCLMPMLGSGAFPHRNKCFCMAKLLGIAIINQDNRSAPNQIMILSDIMLVCAQWSW